MWSSIWPFTTFPKVYMSWQVVVCFVDISKQMKLLVLYFDIIETAKHFNLKQKNVVTMKSNAVFWFKFSVYFLLFTKAEKLLLVEILSPNAALLYQNQLNFSWLHFTIERPSVSNINIQMLTYYIRQRFSLNKI